MIEIANLTNFTVDKPFFVGVAKKVLKSENREIENVSIAFVNLVEIQKVNKKYRKKNMPTDVLSFEASPTIKGDYAQIVICPEVVKEKTVSSKAIFKEELTKVFIHGMLHVLGYDHERSQKEEK